MIGWKILEHVEVRGQGGGLVHVAAVFCLPHAKVSALHVLQSLQVDVAVIEPILMFLGVVFSHHAHHPHRFEQRGRDRKIIGRTAGDAGALTFGRGDGVVANAADDENGVHGVLPEAV